MDCCFHSHFSDTFFFSGDNAYKSSILGCCHSGINQYPFKFYLIFTRELGISGAAIASSLAEMGSFMMLFFYMWIRLDKEKYGLRPVYNGNLLIKVLKLSIWSMLHAFISVAPWFLFFVSIEHLGKIELAISNITRSVSAIFL